MSSVTVILLPPCPASLMHKKSPEMQNNSWHASRLINQSEDVFCRISCSCDFSGCSCGYFLTMKYYSRIPLFWSPKGNGKKVSNSGVSKYPGKGKIQGHSIFLRNSGDFELTEFEIARLDCINKLFGVSCEVFFSSTLLVDAAVWCKFRVAEHINLKTQTVYCLFFGSMKLLMQQYFHQYILNR